IRNTPVLKLGYKASAEQFAPSKLLDFAIMAEQVGLDSAFVSDHFQPWKHIDGHAPSSLVWLGAVAARTTRLLLGTSVLTPTFRYHPSIVAQAFGTLGAMAPGRVILGIGTGEGLNEVPSTGAPWPEFKERFARMREAVTLIRKLWREERVTFEGEYNKTEIKVSYDTDKARALDDTRHWAALALTPEEKMSVEDPVEMQRLADALPVERAASRWIVSNDPEEVVEKVGGYVGLGFKHLVFHAPGPDQERFLKLFSEQVAPKLRQKF